MKHRSDRGFTLIELLMVIAIIGIILAVVIASLSSARAKGVDASIKSSLVNIRSQAELYFTNNGSYGTWNSGNPAICYSIAGAGILADTVISKGLNAAMTSGGNSSWCVVNDSSYAIAVGMKTGGMSWCIDSNKASRATSTTPSAAIVNGVCT